MGLFSRGAVVPVVRLSGPIGMNSPFQPSLSLSALAGVIQQAFSTKGAKAVALQINSPGGSPVQSTLIFNRIRALAAEKKLPVYVFAEDVAASGGYLLALAGDEIYADGSSVIGSIGVISAGFGFDKLIGKYGIERRVYTSGEKKMSLDPFQPEHADDITRLKALQKDVHAQFIDLVKSRRGEKIAAAGDSLFTGEFWSGRMAVELGLIDGIADLRSKMQEKFGKKVKLKLIEQKKSFFKRIPFFAALPDLLGGNTTALDGEAGAQGYSPAEDVIGAVETRAMWQRYGVG